MSFGARTGSKPSFIGSAIGSAADDEGAGSNPFAGITQDATALKYAPSSAAEWALFKTAAGLSTNGPSSLWNCQETSSNLADSIGTNPLLTANAPLYKQTVSGWSRKGVGMGAGGTQRFTAITVPDILTTSTLVLAYVLMPGVLPGAVRNIVHVGTGATAVSHDLNTVTSSRVKASANITVGTSNPATGVVRPMLIRIDRTNSQNQGYSDLDKISPAFDATAAGQMLCIGSSASTGFLSMACTYLYVAAWFGADAEMTDAQIKSMLVALGWSIGWT